MKNLFVHYLLLLITISSVTISCEQPQSLYKREFTVEEKKKLAQQMSSGLTRKFGQGSVNEVMVLREALQLQPTNAKVWRELGIPYGMKGMAADFYGNYEKAVQYDTLNWIGWRSYTYLYFYRDYERAIADFDSLDKLTPNFVDYPQSISIHFMRAICYLKLAQYEKALSFWDAHIKEELKTSSEDYIDPRTWLFQGITYLKMNDFKKARESIDRGLKNMPENADLWLWSAKLSLQNKDYNKAKIEIEKAQTQFDKGYYNYRSYVEEFFQMYQSDIDELKKAANYQN